MSLGIYKQGQGYWVRVLTAALIAVVTLGGAGWMAGQTARFEAQLRPYAVIPAQAGIQ